MKTLKTPRQLPTKPDGTPNPIYFLLEADGIEPQWFRLPNDREVMELFQLLAQFTSLEDEPVFNGAIDAFAALVGAAWWHETLVLESTKPRAGGDWMGYGGQVLDELHEVGFGAASHIAPWAGLLAQRFSEVIVGPTAAAVETVENGEAQRDFRILSDSTSA